MGQTDPLPDSLAGQDGAPTRRPESSHSLLVKEAERRIVDVDHMDQRLEKMQLDRQLAELEAYAVEVFGDRDAALRWLDTGLSELDDLSARLHAEDKAFFYSAFIIEEVI